LRARHAKKGACLRDWLELNWQTSLLIEVAERWPSQADRRRDKESGREADKMRLVILDTSDEVSEWAAKYVMKRINDFKPSQNNFFVLGLPTGMYVLEIVSQEKFRQLNLGTHFRFQSIHFILIPTNMAIFI